MKSIDLKLSSEFIEKFQKIAVNVLVVLLMIAGAKIRFSVGDIPITLQTVVVYGSGLLLNWRSASGAQIVYLLTGLVFPVFAGDGFGIGYLFGRNSSGYLLAFPVVAGLIGFLSQINRTLFWRWLSVQAGSIVLFASGVIWLHYSLNSSVWLATLQKGWLSLIPVDQFKILLTVLACHFVLMGQKTKSRVEE